MVLPLLAAAGLGAKELFGYNRESYKFDNEQRMERETLRMEMQVKRFELFRQDVRDLVELTVDRMDVYHLVGALFLEFCIVLFCEGRVQGSAPPFVLSLFLLSNACAFIYLLLAVWLSMHASIASHSFGVRLLTRFVRLPIPSIKQINAIRSHLRDYERQGIANLLRLPFLDGKGQEWQQPQEDGEESNTRSTTTTTTTTNTQSSSKASSVHPTERPGQNSHQLLNQQPDRTKQTDDAPQNHGDSSISAPDRPQRTEAPLLPEEAEHPIGGEALLSGPHGAVPERHVQLFRQLQSKWQCYDAYCRVCMGLGVNQILQGLSYYAVCHTLVENRSPTTGYALVILFQCTTVALAVLDLAGLKWREILVVQVVGIMPCVLTAWGIAHGSRKEYGVLDPKQTYPLSPLSFLFQVFWLELWLRVAAPSGEDQRKLPRRFRQVLFLDVFGDASGLPTSQTNDMQGSLPDEDDFAAEDESEQGAAKEIEEASQEVSSKLTLAQCAVRRWAAVPDWALSPDQQMEISELQTRLRSVGSIAEAELNKSCDTMDAASPAVYEIDVRKWQSLTSAERMADPFAKCLCGPFEHDSGYRAMSYHYDLEKQQSVFEDGEGCAGAFVLTLQAVRAVISDLDRDVQKLQELLITRNLSVEQSCNLSEQGETTPNGEPGIHAPTEAVSRDTRLRRFVDLMADSAEDVLPNLSSLFHRHQGGNAHRPLDGHQSMSTLLSRLTARASGRTFAHTDEAPQISGIAANSATLSHVKPRSEDPTLRAMAGEHAQHFVPEKLPWQVLSRMTRILQICWLWCGLMAMLKEANIYQVDFQQHMGHEGRRLCTTFQPTFIKQKVYWPHGFLFRPEGLFCAPGPVGDLVIYSPYAMYRVNLSEPWPMKLVEVSRARTPSNTIMLCSPDSAPVAGVCLMVAPSKGGLSIWPAGREVSDSNSTFLSLEGRPWISLAGAVVACGRVGKLLPAGAHMATLCLLLVGWDGLRLPVVALALSQGLGQLLAEPAKGLSHQVLRPCLEAPLPSEFSMTANADSLEPLRLSLEAQSGRLVVFHPSGNILAWDLYISRSLGHYRVPSTSALNPSYTTGLCEHPVRGIFSVGRDDVDGPFLLHAEYTWDSVERVDDH